MLKVKAFDTEHEKDLEENINEFIVKINDEDKEVIDIKYSTSHFFDDNQEQVYSFSALIMYDNKIYKNYKPKRYEIVEKVDD